MASLIISASSTASSALVLNPLIANQFESNQSVVQTYSVKRPIGEAPATIYDQIIDLSAKYGLHTDTALRIANCESNFRQFNENGKVIRGQVNSADIGVFQINEKYHLSRSEALGFDIYQTADNIEYAMWLMKKEGNRHWNWSKPCWTKDNS